MAEDIGPRSGQASIFLSHNALDKADVEAFAYWLLDDGLCPWLDKWELKAGQPWQVGLDRALREAGAVLACVGAHGLGRVQQSEIQFALDAAFQDESRLVIPVLLPNADPDAHQQLGGFLRQRTWVDLRGHKAEGYDQLHKCLHGLPMGPAPLRTGDCPFRGLEAFEESHARWFFGREQEIAHCLQALRERRLLAIVGASGSGKSSLVRAGLLPSVRTGELDQSYDWTPILLRPGPMPVRELALHLSRVLTRRVGDIDELRTKLHQSSLCLANELDAEAVGTTRERRFLVVVDQLEEVFAANVDSSERKAFVAALLQAATIPGGRIRVVFTLRADFLSSALQQDEFASHMNGALYVLGPMREAQLRASMREPARMAGLQFDDGLESRMVDALLVEGEAGEAGDLPLLQFGLEELWRVRDGRRLSVRAYEAMGGLKGALRRRADAVLGQLLERVDEGLIRSIFGRLVQLDDGTREIRRRLVVEDLAANHPEVRDPIEALVRARLLTADEHTVEIAHEALIREWPKLRAWIDEDREALRLQSEITRAAALWEENNESTYLWRGARLARSLELWSAQTPMLSAEETTFLRASRSEAERDKNEANERRARELEVANELAAAKANELKAQRRIGRQLRWGLIGMSIFAGALVIACAWAIFAERLADSALRRARDSARVAIATSLQYDPTMQTVVLREVENVNTIGFLSLASEVAQSVPSFQLLRHPEPVTSVAFSPDGDKVVTGSSDGIARVWNAGGRWDPILLREHGGIVASVSFSPDGRKVATGSWDHTARVWNADGNGESIVLRGHSGSVYSVAFSPDGHKLVTGSEDTTARVWNADGSGESIVLRGHHGGIYAVAFSADGQRVATGSWDRTTHVWNADGSGRPTVLLESEPIQSVAFSPDARKVVMGSWDHMARIWNADGSGQSVVLKGHEDVVASVAFSPDGRKVATGSWDHMARIWNADGSGQAVVLMGHKSSVTSVAFNADGTRVITGSWDNSARIWNIGGRGERAIVAGHGDRVTSVAFSPDGLKVATGSRDHMARIGNVDGSDERVVLVGHAASITSVAFSPDGRQIVTGSKDNTARVWNSDGSGKPVVLVGHGASVTSVAFSPDRRKVITGSEDNTARVWNSDGSGQPLILPSHGASVTSVAFSLDGSRIATGSDDKTVRVWPADVGEKPLVLDVRSRVTSVAFSPDGRKLATGDDSKTGRVWAVDGRRGSMLLRGHADTVYTVAFSPDGRKLVTGSGDHTVRVWNVDGNGEPLVLKEESAVRSVAFSPDGRTVLVGSDDGEVRLRLVSAQALQRFLWNASCFCLSAKQRQSLLGESWQDAAAGLRHCLAEVDAQGL
jgi:WD40 repeat protein/energy-coupling factor transporter ATP-binding protein EcfA2